MADPFLLAHIVAPRTFEIGGRYSPISIRDQMYRASTIVERVLRARLIAHGGRVLVIGAGAAGAATAIGFANLGITTWLIERAGLPFARQAGCTSRWVDPTLYDWPADHWPRGVLPFVRSRLGSPLPWRASHASHLALAWSVRLAAAAARGRLRVLLRTTPAGSWQYSPGRVDVPIAGHGMQSFDVVVSAVGFGTERTAVGAYRGFAFWDTDPYSHPSPPSPTVISGGGDGALQDYLRLTTTCRSVSDLLAALGSSVTRASLQEIYSAQDQADRSLLWSEGLLDDHEALERLHTRVDQVVSSVAKRASVAITPLLRRDASKVHLVHSCTHFDRAYVLNRFAVLLVARQVRASTMVANHRTVDVHPSNGHTCAHPATCHGVRHDVEIAPSTCFAKMQSPTRVLPARAVLIRHGVAPPRLVYAGGASVPQRQLLPYHPA